MDAQAYSYRELVYWLEPMLTDEEFELIEPLKWEADHFAASIPKGDHWS